jgi:formate hydrogenlyase subunit 6/NADH:ubiquinone oxidoreductase subunit I
MKIGTMLGDVTTSLFRRPVTRRYPFERRPAPARLRGRLIWNPEKCTGCQLCCRDCPSNAIELIIIDRASKQFLMHYHIDRCTFCAQCVHSCRFNCLGMSNEDWELAALSRDDFSVFYGNESLRQQYLDGLSREGSAAAEAERAAD